MTDKSTREHIVEAADRLFYHNGFEHTSFADIADAVKISRGNFYYYFKTKDEILEAVITLRRAMTQDMLDRWEREGQTPADRIRKFIDMLIVNRADIRRFGCPVGTLCTELTKLDHASQDEANALFGMFRGWLRRQFTLLGRDDEADDLAMHLLVLSQGISTVANAFQDDKFVKREVRRLNNWLTTYAGEPAPKTPRARRTH